MQAEEYNRNKCLTPEDVISFCTEELDRVRCDEIEAHCRKCAACRDEVSDFRKMLGVLGEDARDEASCDVVDAVMAGIAAENREEGATVIPFGWGLLRVAAMLAAALMLGVMVSGVFQRGPSAAGNSKVAVDDAAKWLVSVQEKDGSWDPVKWGGRKELEASLTGLAMLTLLSSDIDAGGALKSAEKHLLSIQNDDGSFGPECAGSMYNQGIAAKALLELKRTGDTTADSELEKALAYMLRTQTPAGGWSYRQSDSKNSNVGVSVWQLDALLAGRAAGMKGLDGGLKRGMAWLNGVYSQKGDFNYAQASGPSDISSTVKAMGAMCMLSAGEDVLGLFDSEEINDALASVFSKSMHNDPYQSYFAASAAKSAGNSLSGKLQEMRDNIVKQRITRGVNAGSWNADVKWGSVGGRIYSTSMAALALSNSSIGDS